MPDSQRDAQTRTLGVVWQEGMLLSPQHFQQAERAYHHHLAQRFRFARPFGWGIRALELDEQALVHGRLSLIRAEGVFPDGTAFDTALGDPLPAPRDMARWFETQGDRLVVHLGLPLPRPGQPLVAREAGTSTPGPRYTLRAGTVAEDNAEGIDRELALAQKNLVLLFPDEALSQHDSLRLGEIVRTTTGFALRDAFGAVADPYIPPVIAIEGSRSLLAQVRRLLNLLLDRSRDLGELRTQRGSFAEFGKMDAGNAMQLRTVNSFIPRLSHHLQNPSVHPEEVYLLLASLAGELCSYSSTRTPRDVPAYDHDGLGACFGELGRLLEELLKGGPIQRGVRVDLLSKPGSVHVGALTRPELLETRGRLFLGVFIDGPEHQQLLPSMPARLKIASEAKVRQLIVAASPGLGLHEHAPVPAGVPSKAGYDYFELDRSHALWDGIQNTREVAIYVPRDLGHVQLDLVGTWE